MSGLLLAKAAGGVLRLTLDNPAARNSLSQAMLAALHGAVRDAGEDKSVRAVVIAANGPAFCAGHDLKEITAHRADPDKGRAYFERLMASCAALMQAIVDCPKPVIAEVHAIASAAGCQLVASCDLAIASDQARFQTPGVNIGLFCSTPMVALSRNVSRKAAMEMLLTGDAIDAAEAERKGLVNKVVAAAALASEVSALAAMIASKPMSTVRIGKLAFYKQLEMPLAEAYAYAARVMTENLLARDSEEGIGAFIARRAPDWQGH